MCNKPNLFNHTIINLCNEINVQPTDPTVRRTTSDFNGPPTFAQFIDTKLTSNMFLGGTIAVSNDGTRNDINPIGSVCAHGWIDEMKDSVSKYHGLAPSGRCWIFDPKTGNVTTPLFPFTDYRKLLHHCLL